MRARGAANCRTAGRAYSGKPGHRAPGAAKQAHFPSIHVNNFRSSRSAIAAEPPLALRGRFGVGCPARPTARRDFFGWLLDESESSTPMFVELACTHGATVAKTKYVFSVFRRQRYGQERVYQLEVVQGWRHNLGAHGGSHEHIGDLRLVGPARWNDWSYHEVLDYFCAQTNITFTSVLPNPP